MAVTAASFLVAYPEFLKAGPTMVDAVLAQVELQVSDSFGDQRDAAVMLKLADTLALSAFGRDSRLSAASATGSIYGERFLKLAEANAFSASRLGSRAGRASELGDDDSP